MSITSNDPDEIRRQIDETRADLSANVDALGESVRPGNVARRQVDKVKGGVTDLKDRVMGEADSAGSTVAGSVASAPSAAKRKTRGNPWAAGLIAFGAGALLSSLLPATEVEKDAAATIKDKAEPLTDQAKEAAKDLAQSVKEPAQQAVQQVKDRASDAADTVKGEAQQSASDVASTSKDAAQQVREQNS